MLELPEAAAALRASAVLVYPTETFFAIGCLALDAAAVEKIFAAKHRPDGKTLPLLAADAAQVDMVADMGAMPQPLRRFWPGPLTVLLPARPGLPPALVNAEGKVAVRVTPHPQAAALARAAGAPLTSSSANISGRAAVSSLAALEDALLSRVDGMLAGCPRTDGGLPSTVVEPLGRGALRLLREGAVPPNRLRHAGWNIVA